ncbi:Inosine/uridine-preferring nucleoside hydrolase [Rhizodiscina lignyota]|uniref:Inosine/uridine-preferring nucleoside hydrolase n=1 Tax=Rhizodiscina lignyota TaxID=1504668 RepID=A0A9P4IJJ4_9PEZI|nr:Inosine/uridine-preferring nucleoside hydrolase [Rhizodiscina lignyota]
MDYAARQKALQIWGKDKSQHVIPIWLDCDTVFKDAFAILLATQCPRFNLLGVSTVHGNASLENTTWNTQSVLEAIGCRDVPVYPGAAKPFARYAVYAPEYHGKTGLDGTDLLPEPVKPPVTNVTAVNAMYNALINTPRDSAWLVTTGTMTNAALLFALHPNLASHIRGLSIMGGGVGNFFTHAPMGRYAERKNACGNWSPFAEFNIYCDPEAAQAVFSNTALAEKTTFVPLDITHQVLASPKVLELLSYGYGKEKSGERTTLRQMFHELLIFFSKTYHREFGMNQGPPLHDPVAVTAALTPELFEDMNGERFEIYVVPEGEPNSFERRRHFKDSGQCGRTVVKLLRESEKGIRIPRTLEIPTFWMLIDLALAEADKKSPL